MECLRGTIHAPPSTIVRRRALKFSSGAVNRRCWLRAERSDGNDSLLLAAIDAASLRFQETHRAEPLFIDPYCACFFPPNVQMDLKAHSHHYCLATKFIDDKLLHTVNRIDGLKQVVLFTDGMDTRPYRLNWPTSTMIFDVSPERVYRTSADKLQDVGAKIPRSCLFFHIPSESQNIQQTLRSRGFNGSRPSVWAIQGLPLMNLTNFEEILSIVSSLAMNECLFLGELPAWLAESEIRIKSDMKKWMNKLFMSNGFQVETISYKDVATSLDKELAPGDYGSFLFLAQQLRFSDDQMEIWRREFQRIEEEGDEEGFEEL